VIIVLFGPPGGGKGTQADRLAEVTGTPHVSTGAILRTEVARGTDLGREARPIMESGALVPDSLMVRIIESRLAEPDAEPGVILDGFPRTVAQARALDAMLERNGRAVSVIVFLEVPLAVLRQRVLGRARIEGREDDTEAAFTRRMEVYERETAPVVEHYRGAGVRIERIDGAPPVEEVTEQILAVLGSVPSGGPAASGSAR
jgi:adenylate kinase